MTGDTSTIYPGSNQQRVSRTAAARAVCDSDVVPSWLVAEGRPDETADLPPAFMASSRPITEP